jgi:hypothetical protein
MDENQNKTPEEIIADYKRSRKSRNGKILLGVIGGFFALSIIGAIAGSTGSDSSNDSSTSNSTDVVESVDDSWAPTGFNVWSGDSDLAWRWGTRSETKCTYSSGSCWSVMVVTKYGCPSSLYGEINIFDSSDIQIAYTNDTLSTVQPGQQVKMTFDTFNEDADTANIAKFSCY